MSDSLIKMNAILKNKLKLERREFWFYLLLKIDLNRERESNRLFVQLHAHSIMLATVCYTMRIKGKNQEKIIQIKGSIDTLSKWSHIIITNEQIQK